MAVDLLLGLQWGDEGKGKIVDVSDQFLRYYRPIPRRAKCGTHPRV